MTVGFATVLWVDFLSPNLPPKKSMTPMASVGQATQAGLVGRYFGPSPREMMCEQMGNRHAKSDVGGVPFGGLFF